MGKGVIARSDKLSIAVIGASEKGIMMCGTYGLNPKVYLNSGEIIKPNIEEDNGQPLLPENSHHSQWVEACKPGYGSKKHKALTSSFDFVGPLTESVLTETWLLEVITTEKSWK